MKKWIKAGLVAAGMAMLPAASAFATGLVTKIPPPKPFAMPAECSLPSVLSMFCFLGL